MHRLRAFIALFARDRWLASTMAWARAAVWSGPWEFINPWSVSVQSQRPAADIRHARREGQRRKQWAGRHKPDYG
jgi:hypothetical protein